MRYHARRLQFALPLLSLAALAPARRIAGQTLPPRSSVSGPAAPAAAGAAALRRALDRPPALEVVGGIGYPYARSNLRLRVTNFPGTRTDPDAAHLSADGCDFAKVTGLTYGGVRADSAGTIELTIFGYFEHAGTCRLHVQLLPLREDGAAMARVELEALVRVPEPETKQVANTWGLGETLGFALAQGLGSCEGTSVGPTSYPVGIHKVGNDLAFLIRSGPIGTKCSWVSKPWVLPEGVRITALHWEIQTTGDKCVLGDPALPALPSAPGYAFFRGFAPVTVAYDFPAERGVIRSDGYTEFFSTVSRDLTYDGVVYRSFLPGRPTWVVHPVEVRIGCGITAWNDNAVTLILKSVDYVAPPGVSLP